MSAETVALRATIDAHRSALDAILARYRARNPRVFGSVSRGDAQAGSDLDIIVDLEPDAGNELLRICGIGEEFRRELHVDVDVVTESLLRESVSATAAREATAFYSSGRALRLAERRNGPGEASADAALPRPARGSGLPTTRAGSDDAARPPRRR